MVWLLSRTTTCAGGTATGRQRSTCQDNNASNELLPLAHGYQPTDIKEGALHSSLDQWREQCSCCGERTMTVRAATNERIWMISPRIGCLACVPCNRTRACVHLRGFDLKNCSRFDFVFVFCPPLYCCTITAVCTYQFQFSAITKPAFCLRYTYSSGQLGNRQHSAGSPSRTQARGRLIDEMARSPGEKVGEQAASERDCC